MLNTADTAIPCCDHAGPNAGPRAKPAGSRRRRLWELPDQSHCPLIGVCLPLALLRKVAAKAVNGPLPPGDYELHSWAVQECSTRNPLTEQIQRELDRRCALVVQQFGAARSTDALAERWNEALQRADIAHALWAALTHPRCDAELTIRICRDVHMLQHQAGAVARADVQLLRELAQRCESLEHELVTAQQRGVVLQSQAAAEREVLGAQLVRLRAELIARDSGIAALQGELSSVREAMPDLASRVALTERVHALIEQRRHLQRHNAELTEQLAAERARADAAARVTEPANEPVAPVQLEQRAVLCVGGRGGDVAHYRDCIERHGGRFLHHDGGVENNTKLLDSSLAAADLVICQAGCVSHNAYWLVKDHCKRTGKRCVFVDRPSVAALSRGLHGALADAQAPD